MNFCFNDCMYFYQIIVLTSDYAQGGYGDYSQPPPSAPYGGYGSQGGGGGGYQAAPPSGGPTGGGGSWGQNRGNQGGGGYGGGKFFFSFSIWSCFIKWPTPRLKRLLGVVLNYTYNCKKLMPF